MSIIKKPYEISIWKDVLVYVGVDSNGDAIESQNISDLTRVDYQYYTEERLAIIASDTMTSPMRAVNSVLKRNINGVETLTFDMYYQYEDIETGEIVHNPLIDFVIDERKVKLKYDGVWYDFIVKKDDEKGREYKYSYTCNGLAANELGKTGFSIELDTELENNMGTVQQLAEEVLKDSDWQLAESGQDVIQQTNEEALYSIFLDEAVTANRLHGGDAIEIDEGSRIYVYYTPYANQGEDFFQFIYVQGDMGNAIPDLKEDGYTIDCNDTRTYDLYLTNVEWENDLPSFARANPTVAQYRGLRYVRKQLSAYDPVLEQPVLKYTRLEGGETKIYYGYTTTKYYDATSVQNFIYNSTNFAGTSYWGIYGSNTNKSIAAEVFPSVSSTNTSLERAGYLKVQFGDTGTWLVNDGVVQNYSRIDRFDKGDQYRLKVLMGTVSGDTFTPCQTIPINCQIRKYTLIDEERETDIVYFNSTDLTAQSDGDYLYVDMTCLKSATWRDLNKNVGIFFKLKSDNPSTYYIKDIQWYKKIDGPAYAKVTITAEEFNANKTHYYTYDGTDYTQCTAQSVYSSDTVYYEQHLVLEPGDVPQVRVETEYHFYDPLINGNRTSEEDYEFSESDPSLYTPMYGAGDQEFEKIRSITEKESNRFNLLQSLSETFECWVKFTIEHEDGTNNTVDGRIRIEEFTYYNPLNLKEGDDATGTYIYNWATKEYEAWTEPTADGKHTYYEAVQRKRQVKRVTFYKERLVDNYAGFKYGINLNANNRTLDSEQIVTKIIVKDNTCEQAENGFCSIARAQDNPIKENFVYNFDYYTSQGIINTSSLNNDLYLEINGSIGLYPRLSRLNKSRNNLIDKAAPLANSINNITSEFQVAQLMYNEAEKDLQRMLDPESGTIYQYTHYVFADFYNQIGRVEGDQNVPSYSNEIYIINNNRVSIISSASDDITFYKKTTSSQPQSGITYYYISSGKFTELRSTKFSTTSVYYEKLDITPSLESGLYKYSVPALELVNNKLVPIYFQTGANTEILNFTSSGTPEVYIYGAARRRITDLGAEDFINDNFTISTLEKIVTQQNNRDEAYAKMTEYEEELNKEQAEYDAIQDQLKDIAQATDEVEKEFNIKYSRYVQEGSWTDDNYIDDDLYYLDSLAVLYQSAYPKVSYNFGVLDLSQLEGYELYKFDIGSKTYVEDTEFFGYKTVDGLKTPIREQVVVTEAAQYLDEPDKNQLKVQNYKSHFEDLFQRITAATQSLEYHSGEYGRAANAITPEGEVSPTVMQKSLATSSYIIQNSKDQSVTWDETGLQAVNLSDPAQIVRLASSGIIISTDGGNSWGTAITGYGINTNYLTAGQIDADNINIMSGSFPTFKWDALGLRAYGFNLSNNVITSYDPSRYVTYDRFGIYGVNGLTDAQFNNIDEIKDSKNVAFGLTWDGLFIRSTHRDGYVNISSTDDIILVEEQESGGTTTDVIRGKFGLIKEGGSDQNTPNDVYGLVLYDASGNPTLTTQSDGTLQLLDSIKIGNDDVSNEPRIYIGKGEVVSAAGVTPEVYKVMRVSNNGQDQFVVYSDGSIKANSGTIGNMNISSLPATIGVRISPAVGTFKIDGGVATPSSITFTCNTSLEGITGYKWKHNTTTSIDYTNPDGTGSSYTYTYNAADFTSGGIMYLGVQVICSSGTYTDRITISTVSDGDAEVYTYEIESSLGDVINTSSLGSGVTTTTITGHIYRTVGTVTTEVTSSFTFEWHKKIGNVDSIISGESTNSFDLSLDDWNNVQVWFIATEQS